MQTANKAGISRKKPELNFWQIWNMCFGFMGIQFGFALQNANVSRIFQTLGADMSTMPLLWMAAPLTGLIVQPIVGYFSDKTWNRLGRRRPYFLWGAILTSLALIIMPNSPSLWIAAGTLWMLDASINISMEPFRAFVGDNLPSSQRAQGYVMQTFFIGVGAVVASALPYILSNGFGIANVAEPGQIPDTVRYAFYCGACILFLSVLWTVLRSTEYSPEELASFTEPLGVRQSLLSQPMDSNQPHFSNHRASVWVATSAAMLLAIYVGKWDAQLYILAGGALAFGLLQWWGAAMERAGQQNGLLEAFTSVATMPKTMRQLAVVQFFSWFPLFAMWIYTTSAVASYHFGSDDPTSIAYNNGADWVGVLFSAYNAFAVLAALVIPLVIRQFGLKITHQVNLVLGALGLASFMLIDDSRFLLFSMLGVGFAWASILSIPYALLADALPSNKMGIYMGVFNFFIVIPQLVAASLLGLILNYLLGGQTIAIMGFAGLMWLCAAVAVSFVEHQEE